MKKTTIFTSLLMACIIFLSSCFLDPEETSNGSSKRNAIELTVNLWTSGNIVDEDNGGTGEQWFKFEATEETHRVYVKFSTMTRMKLTIYDINYNPVGTDSKFRGDPSTTAYIEKALKSGYTYYIKVEDSYYYGYSGTGQYWIGFTDFPAKPETDIKFLLEDTWETGKIEAESNGGTGEQWFKFEATAETQRVYVKFSTMTRMKLTIYDINYNPVGTDSTFRGNPSTSAYTEKTLKRGDTYYIKVEDSYYYGYSGTGQYWIGFTASNSEPSE